MSGKRAAYAFSSDEKAGAEVIRFQPMFAEILRDLEQGESKAAIAAKFHNTLVKIGVTVCQRIRSQGGPQKVSPQRRGLSEPFPSGKDEGGPGKCGI